MPVMGYTQFECVIRAAGGVTVDRDDIKRYVELSPAEVAAITKGA